MYFFEAERIGGSRAVMERSRSGERRRQGLAATPRVSLPSSSTRLSRRTPRRSELLPYRMGCRLRLSSQYSNTPALYHSYLAVMSECFESTFGHFDYPFQRHYSLCFAYFLNCALFDAENRARKSFMFATAAATIVENVIVDRSCPDYAHTQMISHHSFLFFCN